MLYRRVIYKGSALPTELYQRVYYQEWRSIIELRWRIKLI